MKKLVTTVLAFLGLQAFAEKDGKKYLTEEQLAILQNKIGQDKATKFAHALANDFAEDQAPPVTDPEPETTNPEPEADPEASMQTEASIIALQRTVEQQQQQIETLLGSAADDPKPVIPGHQSVSLMNDQYLFGQNLPFMAIDARHPYNQRAYAQMMLNQHGVIIPAPEASSLDYDTLKTDLGDYYRTRKQDRVQSFLLSLKSLETIFPLESGYQDQTALVNMFATSSFSQADNTTSAFDNVVKGGFKFEAEIIRMFDVMFAHKFTDLKAIEKNWMGYLNREGSDTMKWSFIEFIMVETAKILHNERELRRISGIRVNPTVNVPGVSLAAADGLREFVKKQIALFKIRPFVMGEWTDATIAEYIRSGTAKVPQVVRDTGRLALYLSSDALSAYHKNLESLYGLNQDYRANLSYVKEYPNVKIIVVPNLAESKRMIWTLEGNIVLLEDKPNEMSKFYFEQQDWGLKVWSNWRESVWAYMVGRKWASLAEIPTDYSTQMIFCNDVDYPEAYFIEMADGDVTPSVSRHTSLVSVANTNPTAITNIDDAVVGVPITLKVGNATNAPTIAASGNFSIITAAWNPALGDTITLIKRSDGKFIEVDRATATSDVEQFVADDTTPSVDGGTVFMTHANTQATAITTFDDALEGVTYTIHGAGTTNASTIANAGNFVLTAAMTLSAGTWITLQLSAVNSKFYEINRG